MRVVGASFALLFLVGVASPAAAQLGAPNTFSPTPFAPFGPDPHPLNNPHPMLPNAGLGYAANHFWVPPRQVALQVYVPVPDGVPAKYQTMYAEIPGFYVVQTTTGNLYPERWVIDQLNVGVYRWRRAPAQFVPR
jgi:hypothetical protein